MVFFHKYSTGWIGVFDHTHCFELSNWGFVAHLLCLGECGVSFQCMVLGSRGVGKEWRSGVECRRVPVRMG